MAEIRWTEEAATWLEDIHDYIAQDDPDAAHRVVKGIYEKVQTLKDFPGIGLLYRSETDGGLAFCTMRWGRWMPMVQYRDLSLDEVMQRYTSERRDPFVFEIHRERYRFASTFLRSGSAALDIGCAYGFGTVLLAEKAREVTGIDDHAEVIRHAEAHYGRQNVSYRNCDCFDYDCAPGSLDMITLFEVVEHVKEPEKLLSKCIRWLRPGGRIVLSTPNKLVHTLMGVEWEFHEREYGYSELLALLEGSCEWSSLEILGQNAHMLEHLKGKRGRFVPYATPLRRLVWATIPRPFIRSLRKVFPKRSAVVAQEDPTLKEAVEIGPDNVDLCDTFVVVAQVPVEAVERGRLQ